MLNAEELLHMALEEINNIEIDEMFSVKDLFKGYLWNRIQVRKRHLLGTLFLYYINTNDICIKSVGKAITGQQRYKKIK